MRKEVWRDIEELPGYQISSHGQVRSFQKRVGKPRGWDIVDTPQRILKSSGKYPSVFIAGALHRIHRLVAAAFLGRCPEGMEVCHNDGDAQNNHVENLRYDTHKGNMKDASMGILTKKKVVEIREYAHNSKGGYRLLAQRFSLSPGIVRDICQGYSYKQAGGPVESIGARTRVGKRLITYEEAKEIRERYDYGEKQAFLAVEYGCSASYISHIIHNRRFVDPHAPITQRRLGGRPKGSRNRSLGRLPLNRLLTLCEKALAGENKRALAKEFGVTVRFVNVVEKLAFLYSNDG